MALFASLLYPLMYDTTQMFNQGFIGYFSDKFNYNDVIFIWSVIVVIFI